MAADTTNKMNNFLVRITDEIVRLADCHDRLEAIQAEYYALDYGTTITDEVIAASSSNHIDHAMFIAGITSIEALDAMFNAGHATNIQRFRR